VSIFDTDIDMSVDVGVDVEQKIFNSVDVEQKIDVAATLVWHFNK
jgi:hypothetical protein